MKSLFYIILFLSITLLPTQPIQAQTVARKYLILLKDKTNSPYSVSKPQEFLSARAVARRVRQNIAITLRDLPVNPSYVSQIKQTGAEIWFTSRWFNGVLVKATDAQLKTINALSFVRGYEGKIALDAVDGVSSIERTNKFGVKGILDDPLSYGNSLNQNQMIGADVMHQKGFHGEDMLIAVLDDGFLNSNTITPLKALFDEKRVVATYDFVAKESKVYEDGGHGTQVLSCMAAQVPNSLYGTAYKATYALLRTEDDDHESQIEEANWLIGAEYADSLGADVINSSLGYTQFDDPTTDHKYADLNGNTTIAARAANLAASVGIVCVLAAGNEGTAAWKYIGTPADADSAIAVGAVDANRLKASFSSFGPSADNQVKPDLCAKGLGSTVASTAGTVTTGNGTSFASPILCGMIAAFWQSRRYLTAIQVIDIMRKAGHLYATPNASLGYGVPTWQKAFDLAPAPLSVEELAELGIKIYPNPLGNQDLQIEVISEKIFEGQITNPLGQVIYTDIFSKGVKTVSFASQPAGVYILSVNDGNGAKAFKIVK